MTNTASIHSLYQDDRSRAESAAWAQFTAATSSSELNSSWLSILCGQIEQARGGLLLLRASEDGEGSYGVAAVWPDPGRNMQYLAPAAEKTLRDRAGVVLSAEAASAAGPTTREQPVFIGYPIEVEDVLYGAVVVHVSGGPAAELQKALRLVHWGTAWLVDHFRQQQLSRKQQQLEQLRLVTDVLATATGQPQLGRSCVAVVNELANRLACDRVSLGLEKDGKVDVQAMSNNANFDRRTNLVRLIGEAMDEVLDLDLAMVYPPLDGDELGVLAHAELARETKSGAICSVPLQDQGYAIGVLTLERYGGPAFDSSAVELCKAIGLALGPVLALKQDNELGILQRVAQRGRLGLEMLFGPRHPGFKLASMLLVATVLVLSVAKGEYRVAAKTVIEGAVQRAAVVPFDGYVVESLVRAGDVVKNGQPLVRLDDKDLLLEQVRWTAELQQLEGKQRQAMAAQERASMQLVAAQIRQAQAQLLLAQGKLERARLDAPFDGVVVSGDLSQLLGTPVEKGKVLFEVAPLDRYRVILQVDERDIAHVRIGQTGQLALSGLPGQTLDFSVKQITPVNTAQDGRNHFRVEAHLEHPSERLRPGMEGIGKIQVGEERLIWIWTHNLVDWLRLSTWNWLP